MAVPLLDLERFLAGVPGSADELAASLRAAATNVGFFYVANHGVPAELVASAFAAAERFHALPLERKLEVKVETDNQGYMPMGGSKHRTSDGLRLSDKPNVNEAFFLRREFGPDHPKFGQDFHKENRWPQELPGFRETVVEYFEALQGLARRMLPLYARALELPPAYFDELFTDPVSTLRLTHYPALSAAADEYSIAPHFDSSFMTILAQNKVPGLQILDYQTDQWLDVGVIEGTFIVNIGEVLRRFSNGLFLATPHRAYNVSGGDRYAIPYFMHPNDDVVVEPLPSSLVQRDPVDYPIQTTSEYLKWFASKNYAHAAGKERQT
jgi:isopenicillin N synthase-like dioxygenase